MAEEYSAALNHFSVFTDDCAIRYGECTKLCCNFSIYCGNKCELNFQLMLLYSVAFWDAGVGQPSSPARARVPSAGALLPCSFSQGDIWMCWDGCADEINVCALYRCCYIALKAPNHRNGSPCPLLFTLVFSLLLFLLFSFPYLAFCFRSR